MKTCFAIGLALACVGGSAAAADKAQCDSQPFTLKKPAQPQAKPTAPAARKPVAAREKVATAPSRPKPLADCDKPAAKKPS